MESSNNCKTMIIERDLDNYPCPTVEEMIKFIKSFEYLDKYRICFELMTVTGARVGEAVKARLREFDEDFTIWKYRIQKPKISLTKKLTVIDYKVRTVKLPEWYSEKLRQYFEENKHAMDRGFLFYNRNHDKPHVTTGQLRNILVKKRRSLKLERVWKIVAREGANPIIYKALSSHSFRRFYVSSKFNEVAKDHGIDNALVIVGKLLGHSDPLKTTSLYLSPRFALEGINTEMKADYLKE